MKISHAFPSQYLRAADLNGRQVIVSIDRVELETVGDEQKPCLYFVGKDKAIVLNKTNANTISMAYGDDTDDWHGQQIVLFAAMVDFQGKSMEAIRVRMPKPSERKAAPTAAKRPDPISTGLDDDVSDIADTY